MELYQEDKKVLIVGIQISLIIHLLLYIFLKLLPQIQFDYYVYQQQVEIYLEDLKEQEVKSVQIRETHTFKNRKQELIKSVKPQNDGTIKTYQDVKNQKEDSLQKAEKQMFMIDENNLSLLNKITSSASQTQKDGKLTESVVGDPLSKFDKSIEGDAISRKVVYKPAPIKIETDIPQPSVKVKIFIAPSGDVTKVQLLTFTSDPAVNREIVNYMLKWKFNRIEENIVQHAVLTVYFTQ